MKLTEDLVINASGLWNRYFYVLKDLHANVCIIIAPFVQLAFTFILMEPLPLLVNIIIECPPLKTVTD